MRSAAVPTAITLLVLLAAPARAELPTSGSWFGDRTAAGSPNGHLAIVDDQGPTVPVRFADPGAAAFGPPQTAVDSGHGPVLGLGPSGEALVLWSPGGPDSSLQIAFRPPGGTFGSPQLLSEDSSVAEHLPAIGFDAAGTATVLWPGEDRILVRTRAPDGTWSAPEAIRAPGAFEPEMVVAPSGAVTATWRQSAPGGLNRNRQVVATRPPGGRFGPAQIVAGVPRDPGNGVVSANDRGDAVVAWVEGHPQRDGDYVFSVFGAFRTGYGPFGRPIRISHPRREGAGPSVSVDPSGRMVLAWTASPERRAEARIRTRSGALLPPRVLSRDTDELTGPRALAIGNGIVTWLDRDPGLSVLRVARATGTGVFAVSTLSRTREETSTISPLPFATPTGLAIVGPKERIVRTAP